MSAKSIQFELVSPEEKLISEPMAHAVLPGTEGEVGVSVDHTSLVLALKAGVVTLYKSDMNDAQPRKIFIAGGFADISAENCTVLAEEAVNVNDLDQAALEQQLTNLGEDMTMAVEQADKDRVEASIKLVHAKIEAITGQLIL